MSALRIVFMGTPDFAKSAFLAILEAGHEIVAVYTQPPRPAGRGQKERLSAVHEAALSHSLPVFCPLRLNDPQEIAAFQALRPDVVVVAAYGLLLPRAILEIPRFGCLNIHASLLPRWRGAAPIARAILAGDKETGITIMRMEEGLDSGPMIAQRSLSIAADMDAGVLHDSLAAMGAGMMVEILARLPGSLESHSQPEAGVTYAHKITKEEAKLDWQEDSALLVRKVRAFSPYPGAYALAGDVRIKVLSAAAIEDKQAKEKSPGEVIDDHLLIACGKGALRLTRLQRPGRSPMDAADFLRGFAIPKGSFWR